MYLKRLDLQGFKSFHVHTLFEFGPGITAVVGPNGAGKSNVAEAIRWVLGEQASRSLRARRLEDVIFSGSSQKAAVGMAEASMTLDNSEGWLPVDYSEVVVSRRAYRNGESEYLINKARVRLRDVVDLFLRAQVGQNSYAFMGQGLVEEVLLMRPEERRRLLEEAADVRLLRTRLDEARDRLAATRENLERVDLLLDEIGPRLQQLERQAARAADHERLARELSQALQALYGHQWSEAQEALTAARARLDQKQQALKVATRETKACEEGLAALTHAIQEQESEVSSRRQRLRELRDLVHTTEQRLALDRERAEAQAARRKEIDDELQSLRQERSDGQKSLDGTRQREVALLPEIEEAKTVIASRRQELTELEQENATLRRRIADAEDRIQRGRRAAAESEQALGRLGDEEARVENEALRRASLKRDLVEGLAAFGRDFRMQQERTASLKREIGDLEQERLGLSAMVERGRQAVLSLETEVTELAGREAQLEARQDALRRLQQSQEGMDAGARILLAGDAEARHAAEGLLGLVRDIVRVPPGLERAIEAALAENIQALVFENIQTAVAALEVLDKRQAGRALLFPLDTLRPTPPLNLLREKGIVGVAARLVRCENRFRPLVDTLLGRTIVVETFQLAREVLRRGMGSVVTLEGVLLRPVGSVAGGHGQASAQTFTRQRELDEIPGELALVQSRRIDVQSRLRREKEALTGTSEALGRAETRLQSLRDEMARSQSAVLESRGRLILLRSEARTLWSELRRSEGVHGDWRQRRDDLRAQRDRANAEVQKASEDLRREREALAGIAARRTATIDAVSESAAAHADLEGEARSLARQAEMLQTSLRRVDTQVQAREESRRALERETNELRARMQAQTVALAKASEDLQALEAELEPAEGEFEHLVGRERSMREQLSAAQQRLLLAEREQIEADGEVKLRNEEIAGLRETIAVEGYRPEGGMVVPLGAQTEMGVPQPGLPPIRGGAPVEPVVLRERVAELRRSIRALGPVNEQAPEDYSESKERYDFLKGQVDDLTGSEKTLLEAIAELESSIRERMKTTYTVVDREFQRYFEAFFAGGKAKLVLTQPDDFANTGVDVIAQPPGKRVNTLAMLSGGERSLTAIALLFALLEAHPSPICVLDEVDAALDEANVARFVDALRTLAEKTQFIVITHNPRTVEAADAIYGISMGADNTSKVLSVRLSDPTPD